MFDGASPNVCTRLKACSSPFDFTQCFYEKFYGPPPACLLVWGDHVLIWLLQ